MAEFRVGDVVIVAETEDWPEHLFEITEVHEDCVGGFARSGPFTGEYGEPDLSLILARQPH